jgi:phosphodiesterase/alkaline phosphatase D-like protein
MQAKKCILGTLLLVAVVCAAQTQPATPAAKVEITKPPVVEHVDGNSAIIAWSTNVSSSSKVWYGTTAADINKYAEAPWGGMTHRVTIKGLQPNTTYYFRAESAQGQGTGSSTLSDPGQFKTTAGPSSSAATPDSTKLVAGPIPQDVTETSANVWWQTKAPSATVLKWSNDPEKLERTENGPSDTQSHSVALKNLTPGTNYFFAVMGPSGEALAKGRLGTLPANSAQGNKVQITRGPALVSLGSEEATITWATNAPSSSIVRYGTELRNMTQTAEAPWGQTDHKVTIKGLQPNTKYFFRVVSTQAQGTGTAAESVPAPFQTEAPGQAAMNLSQQ